MTIRDRNGWLRLTLAGVGVAAAAALLAVALLGGVGSETIEVDVPPGTNARIEAGEQIALLPRELVVEVGDSLVVRNRDVAVHEVGPYIVGPGDTIRQTFTDVGEIEGLCTLHPSGRVRILVR
jgi:plastocyanin